MKLPRAFVYAIMLVMLVNTALLAQHTVIEGVVTDSKNRQGIPFCNVYFKGTTIGTTTDIYGAFKLETNSPSDSLSFHSMGYETKEMLIKRGTFQRIDIKLSPSDFLLDEVVITPGENPAFIILERLLDNRKVYKPSNLKNYRNTTYSKVEISLDNVNEEFKRRPLIRPFVSLLDSLQSNSEGEDQTLLPIFFSETVSECNYLMSPYLENEKLIATNTEAVINIEEYLEPFLGSQAHKYNFYENWVRVFDRQFVSPIASGGKFYYKYYLIDSTLIDNEINYLITFEPRRMHDPTFKGRMWVSKNNYILKRVEVEVGKLANLNYIDKIRIEQELELVDGVAVFPIQSRVFVDAQTVGKKALGLVAKYRVAAKDIEVDVDFPSGAFATKREHYDDSKVKSEDYWTQARTRFTNDTLEAALALSLVDSLSQMKPVRRFNKRMDFLLEGYWGTKYFEFGHYIFLLGYNEDEGFRTRVGGRTTMDFSDKWLLKGHAAYGFGDKRFKYSAQAEYFLDKDLWMKVGFRYRYDIDKIGVNQEFIDAHPFLAFSIALSSQFGGSHYAALGEDISAWYRTDLGRGLQQTIIFRHYNFRPYGNFTFAYYDEQGEVREQYVLSEVSLKTRFARRERFIVKGNNRIGVNALKGPVLSFGLTLGFKDVLNSTFSYQKLSLGIAQKVKVGHLGKFHYDIKATKVFGTVPPTLLNIMQGNESFLSTSKGYNMMRFFEFVADQSLEFYYFHHFEGMLMNKVPLLNGLNWRFMSGIRGVWGSYSDSNQDIIPVSDISGDPVFKFRPLQAHTPYVEASVGFENVFKVLKIQYFRRFTYLNESKHQPWAIKLAFYFSF